MGQIQSKEEDHEPPSLARSESDTSLPADQSALVPTVSFVNGALVFLPATPIKLKEPSATRRMICSKVPGQMQHSDQRLACSESLSTFSPAPTTPFTASSFKDLNSSMTLPSTPSSLEQTPMSQYDQTDCCQPEEPTGGLDMDIPVLPPALIRTNTPIPQQTVHDQTAPLSESVKSITRPAPRRELTHLSALIDLEELLELGQSATVRSPSGNILSLDAFTSRHDKPLSLRERREKINGALQIGLERHSGNPRLPSVASSASAPSKPSPISSRSTSASNKSKTQRSCFGFLS